MTLLRRKEHGYKKEKPANDCMMFREYGGKYGHRDRRVGDGRDKTGFYALNGSTGKTITLDFAPRW
jgi:hypothetical protein